MNDAPALVNFWAKINSPAAQAKTLQLELMQLWSKYYFAAQLEAFGVGLIIVLLED